MGRLTRRTFVAGAAAMLSAFSRRAFAQSYPSQDIHLICAFPPGSGADIIVRYFGERLRPLTNRTVIVENKAGASGSIATEYIARARPDGYTIMIHGATALAANMHLFRKPPVDVTTALQLAATLNRQPTMLVVHPDKPWTSVAQLTDSMRQKGEKASYAISNTVGKIMAATYKQQAGLAAVEVSYRTTGEFLNDMQSGAVDYGFQDNATAIAQARQNHVRILAVSTAARLQAAPEFPTMTESGYPMDMVGWWAAIVPAATPKPIVTQINQWINEIITSEDGKRFLNSIASDPWVTTPDEAQAFLRKQVAQWGEWIRAANIEPLG